MTEPTAHFETVTPVTARELLDANESNRALRPQKVAEYAADIKSGNWHTTGASIVIGADGRLLDGQHRLAAIVQTGKPLVMLVVRNAEPESQVAMDSGLKRNLTDHLKMKGEANTVVLATSLRKHWAWVSGQQTYDSRQHGTNAELLACLERNPSLRKHMTLTNRVYQTTGLPGGVAGACVHQFNMIDPAHMRAFFTDVMTGEMLESGSPTLTLRNWLFAQKNATGGRRPYQNVYHAVTLKAWNAWVSGAPVKQLKWKRGGIKSEAFPEMLDLDGEAVKPRDEFPQS